MAANQALIEGLQRVNRRDAMSSEKRYRIEAACPQCGCSSVSHLTKEEIRKRFGDVPNVELECSACMHKYSKPMKEACPEWDRQCRMDNE